ncbi:class I SAM-dependent methyltransferase [Paenibacillus camerounensis]|uniref:class I SAM-dependent methyltransferase n=1 Tax=Paenibacillus camerounensis TaxID=1243663 RepID=UPI0005A826A3|nr:class I SAM-dependent methyltransferase [Paenibacillus camerounensis]
MAQSNKVQQYWNTRGLRESLDDHSRLGGSAGFREHPVWFGALPPLLERPAGGRVIRRIADMGSGTGIIAEYLARLGYEVIAVEFAESRARLAEQRLAPYPMASVRVGDVADPPIAPGEIDAVISRNLLWLLPDPLAVLERWALLTGKNGRIAAIDSTRRLDHRKRRAGLTEFSKHLLSKKKPAAHSAQLLQTSAAPLANIRTPDESAGYWRQAGLLNVSAQDLSWITAVKEHYEHPVSRYLSVSKYYSVIGDCP